MVCIRVDGVDWDLGLDPVVWAKVGVAGGFNRFISERSLGYISGEPWTQWCVVYDSKLKHFTFVEYR